MEKKKKPFALQPLPVPGRVGGKERGRRKVPEKLSLIYGKETWGSELFFFLAIRELVTVYCRRKEERENRRGGLKPTRAERPAGGQGSGQLQRPAGRRSPRPRPLWFSRPVGHRSAVRGCGEGVEIPHPSQ